MLTAGGSCDRAGVVVPGGLAGVVGEPDARRVVERWQAYERAHQKIGYARSGRRASFDFTCYDAAVGEIAAAREQAFDDALHSTERLITGSPIIPLVAMGVVILLVPLSVRKRLAEYR